MRICSKHAYVYATILTILYVNQQSINKVPKIWGQQNEKGNGGSPDPFLARLRRALRKKGLARETIIEWRFV